MIRAALYQTLCSACTCTVWARMSKSHVRLEAYDFDSLDVYIPSVPYSDCKTDGDLKAW